MKSVASVHRALRPLVFLFIVSVALSASSSAPDVPGVASAPGSSRPLQITLVTDPAIVGVSRLAAPPASLDPVAGNESIGDDPGPATWLTDYPAALRQAARENKIVLLNFTGSDWCGWCVKLEKDVFSKPEFAAYASRHLVLVKVDFPRKSRLPAAEVAQNAGLQRQFGVRGFPTIIAVDASGRKVAEIGGYVRGGPKSFIAALEKQTRR